jgi:O-antigen ligase
VLARVTMLETLREALEVTPGADPVPRGPGPGTSLVLDLLAWVPALLVLTRGAVDSTFHVRFTLSHGLMFALAGLAVLSPLWAADKFAAVVSAFHWLSAVVFLWAASQFVRSSRRLRVVAGACVGLLLVFGASALNARFVEQPEMRKEWEQNREQHLRARGFELGSFNAQMFEAKLLRGEMMGFFASPNTFAAVTVLLGVVALGVVVQRLLNRDGAGWIVVPLAGIGLAVPIIVWVDSKTAYATPLLAAGMLGGVALLRGWLRRHARLAFAAGVTAVAVAAAAVVGHGLFHGSLVISSLTFRWRYWVGAARVFTEHPLLGVGWENFGLHYLAARLPVAAEEVRDPHNFVVRFFTELGAIGGALAVAWMLRLWWEMTRPATVVDGDVGPSPAARRIGSHGRALPAAGAVVVASMTLGVLATVDLGFITAGGPAGPAYVTLRLLDRALGAALLLAGMWATTVRSADDPSLDGRPAPWLLCGVLAGLGVFLLHNLVDFAMFEVGPMFLFACWRGRRSACGRRGGR